MRKVYMRLLLTLLIFVALELLIQRLVFDAWPARAKKETWSFWPYSDAFVEERLAKAEPLVGEIIHPGDPDYEESTGAVLRMRR